MKKLLLSAILCAGAMSMSAQNEADFNTLSGNTSYGTYTTTAGWKLNNCAVITAGVPTGVKAPTLNGKTSAVGTVTSPTLDGGIGKLSFSYTNTFAETNGVQLQIDIQQGGQTVKTETLTNASVTQKEVYSYTSPELNVEGEFVIFIKNLSPSNNGSKNKDRVSIWNLTWTSYGEAPAVATPVIELVEQGEGFAVKMTCATEGAEIRYTDDETAPTATSTLYEAPVEVWYTTTFKAVAVKDGELSNVATFTANPPYILDGFANLFDFAEGIENNQKVPVVIKGSMTAVYQSADKRYLFLNDGSKNMLVFSSSAMSETYSNGDTFSRIDGNFTKYNGQLELVDCTLSGASEGTAIAPKTYFVDMIASNVLYDYLTLENVSISGVNGKNGTITDADGNTVKLYNQLGLEGVTDMAGCTVTGFVGLYNTTIQFWPTEISAGQEVVAAPTFDPESGSSIPLYTEINIYAEEGAEIYYMIEGMEEDFAPYYGPEYAFQTGTMVIKAYAKKGDAVSETVTATYTVTKPLPDLVWVNRDGQPVTEVIWVIDGTPEQKVLPEPSGMLAGEPTLTSSNPEVASINQEYMTVEVHKVGETTITISVEESFQYAAGEASFLLKVITAEDAKNINAVVEFSNPINEGFSAAAKEKTWESTDGTFLFKAVAAISGNSSYPVVTDGQLKLYGTSNNTVTVSAPAGYRIKEVSFNKATGHKDYQDWLPTVNGTVCVLDEAQSQAEGSLNCGLALPTAVDQVVIGCGGTTKHIRLNSISFLLTDAASGIEGVETETADSAAEYYNLQGVRVENPAAGLYIRRQGGKVAKVIVR